MRTLTLTLACALLLASPASASIATTVASTSNAWLAYSQPLSRDETSICCWNQWNESNGQCNLEDDNGFSMSDREGQSSGLRSLVVFLRVSQGKVDRVRAFSSDCTVHTGKVPMQKLSGIAPAESVNFLASLVKDSGKRIAEHALATISLHETPEAFPTLERFARSDEPENIREKAVFWLGQSGGEKAMPVLLELIDRDESSEVREKAVFALSQIPGDRSTEALVRLAKSHEDLEVRKKSLFWLSQKAGKRITAMLRDTINNDPNSKLREMAVFAISQRPADESVPALIELLDHRDPRVRKKALFWLGQSADPRAISAIEKILLD